MFKNLCLYKVIDNNSIKDPSLITEGWGVNKLATTIP